MKVGDTSTGPRRRLVDRYGAPAVLTGATVVMHVQDHGTIPVTVIEAADGIVAVPRGGLAPPAGRSASTHNVEFEVTYSDGQIQTFPEESYATLTVWADLDPA